MFSSTEGVTLSGAGRAGATANGSTLWRHPDTLSRGPKVQDACMHAGISQANGQRRYLSFYFLSNLSTRILHPLLKRKRYEKHVELYQWCFNNNR